MVYKWANGYPFKISASDAGSEFEKIEAKYGEITIENVLSEATDPESKLHKAFEWDDVKAAHQHRLKQAQDMIAHLVIEVENVGNREPEEIRAVLNVSEGLRGSYLNVYVAMSNEETKEIIMQKALKELRSFKEKYKKLNQFAELIKEIDRLLATT